MLLYTPEPEALRAVLREQLGWDFLEAHDPPDGWQIFALQPTELGVHPSDGSTRHELGLMCDDLEATVAIARPAYEWAAARGDPDGTVRARLAAVLPPWPNQVPLIHHNHHRPAALMGISANGGIQAAHAFNGVDHKQRDISRFQVLAGHHHG